MKTLIALIFTMLSMLAMADAPKQMAPQRREAVEVLQPEVTPAFPSGTCAIIIVWKLDDPMTPVAEYESPMNESLVCRWQQSVATKIALDRLLRGE